MSSWIGPRLDFNTGWAFQASQMSLINSYEVRLGGRLLTRRPSIEYTQIYINIYQWRLVTFQTGDAVQKNNLHFLKFYFNLRFFLPTSSNTSSFSLFFKFNIRFKKKNIMGPSSQTDIAVCELVTTQSLRWKSTIVHNESACL